MNRPFAFAVLLPVFLSDPALAQEKSDSWVGQQVMARRADVKFGDYNPDGTERVVKISSAVVTVLREKDGWLRVHSSGTEAWVQKSDMVLVRDAPAHFTEYIRANPNDSWAYGKRGTAWYMRGEFDNAIKDLTEAIRLNPDASAHFTLRGSTWLSKKEYDKAIKDYDEAIRLDPTDASAFINRGAAWRAKKEYDKAIKDFDEAIRLDPKIVLAFISRGDAWSAKKEYDKAIKDYDEAIRLDPKDAYPVLLGHFAAREADNESRAKRYLNDAAGTLNQTWPYPVLKFLLGQIDEPALLKAASDDDKRTEAHCYLGLDHKLKGRKTEALTHFRWVKEHGNTGFFEYGIALAELDELEKAAKPKR